MSTSYSGLRIALLQDHLTAIGGAEQVFLYMAQEFAEADIFTLSYNPRTTLPDFRRFVIRTSWANRLIQSHSAFKLLFPFATEVMRHWDLGDYDIVLISSATSAKYLKRSKAKHICYCYFPTRAIWNREGYFDQRQQGIVQRVFRAVLPLLKRRDRDAAGRIDRFIAISETTRTAIKEIYDRESEVLLSPIPVERFQSGMAEEKKDFYLLVSRLEHWKRVDYAIEAFNRSGKRLVVVGTGAEEAALKAAARENISFVGSVSMEELIRLYGQARAVIFTPALEYGLVPIEAVAAGTPVIALGYGGVRETMIGTDEAAAAGVMPTAVFFHNQDADSLIEAVTRFEGMHFDRTALSHYAERFGIAAFQRRLREIVGEESRMTGRDRPI